MLGLASSDAHGVWAAYGSQVDDTRAMMGSATISAASTAPTVHDATSPCP